MEIPMSSKKQYPGSLTMTLLVMTTSLLAREGVAKGWAKSAGDQPPPKRNNNNVTLREAAAWALVSGSVVGLARVVARRVVAYRGKPEIATR
jgi:Protein of unknown function (DUF4235)